MTIEPFHRDQNLLLAHDDVVLNDGGIIKLGITTRKQGVSQPPYVSLNMGYHVGDTVDAVTVNRERLARHLNIPLDQWVQAEQIHGNRVESVTSINQGDGARDIDSAVKKADGLLTRDNGLLLTACYADCVPVFFYVKSPSVVGIVHAGWRGTCGEIAGHAVRQISDELNIGRENIYAVIGPSIQSCCYEVDKHVIDHVRSVKNINDHDIIELKNNGKFQLSLQELNWEILKKHGIPSKNIQVSKWCTSCRADLFYSHRTEGGPTGRMLGYIVIEDGVG